jgi:hypothetical protein
MALARELWHEYKTMENDEAEDSALKNRMKSASHLIFAQILDEVEGGINNEDKNFDGN